MKKIISLIMVCLIFLTACAESVGGIESSSTNYVNKPDVSSVDNVESVSVNSSLEQLKEIYGDEYVYEEDLTHDLAALNANYIPNVYYPSAEEFYNLNDEALIEYVENQVTSSLMTDLNPDEFVLKDISITYISKEYIEELEYNSKSNIFFGYTLEEVDQMFQGTRYVFSLGEDGQTIVKEFEGYDDTYNQILRNVAIGAGVIVICVTISVVSAGVGAPAVSYIFAASAKTAAEFALTSAAISGTITTAITAYETGDWDQALKQGALSASDSFKWGAIMGAVVGGGESFIALKTATQGGLTMDEAATIIAENGLPACFVKQIKSMDEFNELVEISKNGGLSLQAMAEMCMRTEYPLSIVKLIRTTKEGAIYFEQAQLTAMEVGGNMALVCEIDLNYQSVLAGKIVTNLERMSMGYAPIDPISGLPYELHHVGQSIDSPLAILTRAIHREGDNYSVLHFGIDNGEGVHALLSDYEWSVQRQDFWKALYELIS